MKADLGAAFRAAAKLVRPREGERLMVSGNAYAMPLLDAVVSEALRRGASVLPSVFSDETLAASILSGPPGRAATRWMPKHLGKGVFEVDGAGRVKLDRVVTLFSRPTSSHPDGIAASLGRGKERFKAEFADFTAAAGANQYQASADKVPFVLLDLASPANAANIGLDYERVSAAYARAMTVKPAAIRKLNAAVRRFFAGRKKVRISCPRGTDFEFDLDGQGWHFEDMDVSHDRLVQIPGGEAYTIPVYGSARGALVSGPDGFEGRTVFEKGFAVEYRVRKRGRWAKGSHPMVDGTMPHCEFGVGTNPGAEAIATGPIYEKAYGTVHIGVGGNSFFGGKINIRKHRDFIIENPVVEADGILFAAGGKWVSGCP